MNSKKLATVTVTYNRKDLLLENIRTLMKQNYPIDSIIIIDNHGTDGTREAVMTEFPSDKIDYIYLDENTGGAGGFYTGCKHAYDKGYDWVLLMDDDGRPINNDTIKELMNYIDKNKLTKDDKVIINSMVMRDEKRLTFGLFKNEETLEDTKAKFTDGFVKDKICPFNGTLVSHGLMKEIGFPIKEFVMAFDEQNYLLRAKEANAHMATIINSLYYHPLNRPENQISVNILGKKMDLYVDPLRKVYYGTRNRTYTMHNIKNDIKFIQKFKDLLKRWLAVCLVDCQKITVVKLMFKGYIDGRRGKLGKIDFEIKEKGKKMKKKKKDKKQLYGGVNNYQKNVAEDPKPKMNNMTKFDIMAAILKKIGIFEQARKIRRNHIKRKKLTKRYKFENRKKDKNALCIILAGYQKFTWDIVFKRIKKFAPDNIDICICSSGIYRKELSEIAKANDWSYLSIKRNCVTLLQNVAINLFDKAEYIYKIDEDIFITEGYFTTLRETMDYVNKEGDYDVGIVAPLLPVNGFCHYELIKRFNLEDEYKALLKKINPDERFIHITERESSPYKSPEVALFLWDKLPQIDELSRIIKNDKPIYQPCPIRFSIGAILFKRELWEEMKYFNVPRGCGMGMDETQICSHCVISSRAMIVARTIAAGHLGYSCQKEAMKEYYNNNREKFDIRGN